MCVTDLREGDLATPKIRAGNHRSVSTWTNKRVNGNKKVALMLMMMMMNCCCGMGDQQKACGLIFSRDHSQKSSPSRISNTPLAGFEPTQNLSSGLFEWNSAVVLTTSPQRHKSLLFQVGCISLAILPSCIMSRTSWNVW